MSWCSHEGNFLSDKHLQTSVYILAGIRIVSGVLHIFICLVSLFFVPEVTKMIGQVRDKFSEITEKQTENFLLLYMAFGVYYVVSDVALIVTIWMKNLFWIRVWLVLTSIAFISDTRTIIFDMIVGSIDYGLLSALGSALINGVSLVVVHFYSKHLRESIRLQKSENTTASAFMLQSHNFWDPEQESMMANHQSTNFIQSSSRLGQERQIQEEQNL